MRGWLTLILFAAAALAAAVVLFLVNPANSPFLPPCFFHALTGLHCPGCGSSRAVHQLLHGNVAAAFGLNPLAVLLLPVLAYTALSEVLRVVRGRALPEIPLSGFWLWAFVALVVAFWIAHNIPAWPFTLLAP